MRLQKKILIGAIIFFVGVVALSLVHQASAAICIRGTPLISINPGNQTASGPGIPLIYTVTITNTDSRSCAAAQFTFISIPPNVPIGWSDGFNPTTLSLQSGAQGQVDYLIASPGTVTTGLYPFQVSTTNTASGISSTWITGNYIV